MGSTTVRVAQYQVLADVGINADEANRTQPLVVTVDVRMAGSDIEAIAETVDYRRIVAEIEALACVHIPLIETFASRLARNCLRLAAVTHARVEIDKPFALTRGMAGVVVKMTADEVA